MALFNEQELRRKWGTITVKAQMEILDEQKLYAAIRNYDIFLSHSYADKDLALLLKKEIESLKFTVYLDWYDDPELDRANVTKATADRLRETMKNSKCLFYATSINSKHSAWMPWECGYADGLKGKVAICPATKTQTESSYKGQEYLGLYPYIDEYNGNLCVIKPSGTEVFSNWLKS